MAAGLCLLQIEGPPRPRQWGRLGEIIDACREFFWAEDDVEGDPVWFLNEPFARCIWPLLEMLELEPDGETRTLFLELKDLYSARWA